MARKSRNDVNWGDMEETPFRASRLLKNLGNPKAYALVRGLLDEEVMAVDEMAEKLHRAPQTVSKILRPLRHLEVVRYQRDGANCLYTVKDPARIAALLRIAEEFIEATREQK